ncbi:hypothetical protein [Arenibacter certesii]|nr:hypothetical protein [Arenibacter certesii]
MKIFFLIVNNVNMEKIYHFFATAMVFGVECENYGHFSFDFLSSPSN